MLALLGTVLFLGFVLGVLGLLVGVGVSLVRGRSQRAGALAHRLVLLVVAYLFVLVGIASGMPRRVLPPGRRECFDDWCVAALGARPVAAAPAGCGGAGTTWLVELEVASEAKRVRQRAADAEALVEDGAGRRYEACAPPGGGGLRVRLDPGQSLRVELAFALPGGAVPAGVVVRHGAFPGALILADDQALLHPPTLLRLAPASTPGEGP